MAELKDGALLFSLRTWVVRESERQALARAEAARAEADERAARALVERRRVEVEARRIEELRQAELEWALGEAAARARLEVEALKRDHEERLRAIRLSTARFKERIIGGAVALLLSGVALGLVLFHFGRSRPELLRTRAAFETLLEAERARTAQAERLAEERGRGARALAAELARCAGESAPRP